MKLFLNTTVAKKAVVSLIDQKGKVVATEKAEEPLIAIDRLLNKTNTRLQDLEEISAHPGPGSFTGLPRGILWLVSLGRHEGSFLEADQIRDVDLAIELDGVGLLDDWLRRFPDVLRQEHGQFMDRRARLNGLVLRLMLAVRGVDAAGEERVLC